MGVTVRWTYEQLRRRGGIAFTIAIAIAVLLGAGALFAWRVFGPDRFESDLALGEDTDTTDLPHDPRAPLALSDSTRIYLIYSVGSKGVSGDDAERLRIHDLGDRGADGLTDTMMLLFVDPPTRKAALLSIPRDVWAFDRGHRVNASFNLHGLQAFIDDVSKLVGVPIHHVVQVNFAGFSQLVDDIGGVALRVPRALADLHSVLYVPRAGCWRFDGASALAYVRSRHTLTVRGDTWVVDRTASDIGRMGRQRALLAAAWEQLRGPSLIAKIPSLLSAAKRGLRLDDDLGVRELADLARTFADIGPWGIEAYTLPTTGRRIGGAAAQVLVEDAALPLFRRLRAWPPGDGHPPSPEPSATSSPRPDGDEPTEDDASPPEEPPGDAERSPSPTDDPPRPPPEPDIQTLRTPDEECRLDTAAELPDPRAGLLAVYRARDGDVGGEPETDASPSEEPTEPDDEPTDEPSDDPTPDTPTPSLSIPPLPD